MGEVDFGVYSVNKRLVQFCCKLARVWVERRDGESSLHVVKFAPEMSGGGVKI